jgi:beta-phosphoglucomutase-like phosphatase (HAD superfamily)
VAAQFVAESWQELIDDYGILPDDPTTWEQHPYVRTGDQPAVHIMASRGDKAAQAQLKARRPPKLSEVAPRALGAISDVVAGNIEDVDAMELPRSLAVNLSTKNPDGSQEWQPPKKDWPGW